MSNIFGIKEVNGMPLDERPYPEDFEPKCDYVNCFAGQGLAGRGVCFLNGDPTRCDCSAFEFEEVALVQSGAEDIPGNERSK